MTTSRRNLPQIPLHPPSCKVNKNRDRRVSVDPHTTSVSKTPPATMTVSQLAKELQVSERTIRRMVHGGDILAPIKIGSQLRWIREEILTWVTNGAAKKSVSSCLASASSDVLDASKRGSKA